MSRTLKSIEKTVFAKHENLMNVDFLQFHVISTKIYISEIYL